jgi:hypothetical protein
MLIGVVEQASTDAVSKKQLVEFLQANSSSDVIKTINVKIFSNTLQQFQKKHKLNGKAANIIKNSKKDALVEAYKDLFESKAFRNEEVEPFAAFQIIFILSRKKQQRRRKKRKKLRN